MSVTCRPQTTGGIPNTPNSPIRHPLSRLGQHNNLNVRGSSATPNIMSFRDVGAESFRYVMPNRLNESLDFSVPQRRKLDIRGVPQMSLDEIEQTLEKKLRKEHYSIQCLFRNNDVSGRGFVTKGALLKIMYTLCGSIRVEHFHQLLEKYGMDELPVITFAQFEHAFGPRVGGGDEPSRFRATRLANRHVTVAHAQTMLRERAQHSNFDLRRIVPDNAFNPGGIVLKPQWREALELVGIHMTDQSFEKFWERFDREGTGAIRTDLLCSILHLDKIGRPVTVTAVTRRETGRPKSGVRSADEGKAKSASVQRDGDKPAEEEKEEQVTKVPLKTVSTSCLRKRFEQSKQSRPRFDSIKDNLLYMFEEAYNAVMSAFQRYDHKSNGYVTTFDCRQILREFGFDIPFNELDAFLSRIGLSNLSGNVNYKEFCNKFQSRADFGLVSRIFTNIHHIIHEDVKHTNRFIPEQLEAKICEFFQENFLKLLGLLQRADPEKKNQLPQDVVHSIIDDVLGFKTTDEQFQEFLQYLKTDKKSGEILYNDMLQLFNKSPKTWRSGIDVAYKKKMENTPLAKNYPPAYILGAQPNCLVDRPAVTNEEREKRFAEVCIMVDDILHNRFHSIDKLYKKLEYKNTGRLSKALFADLLHHHGLTLTEADLNRLWATLDPEAESQMHYRQILRHFMTTLRGEASKTRLKIKQSRIVRGLKDPNLQRLREHRKLQREQTSNAIQEHPVTEATAVTMEVSQERANELCERVRQQVVANWEPLKDCLRSIDQAGYSTIDYRQIRRLANQLDFHLDDGELSELIAAFDYRGDGRFNYIDFLKKFVTATENGNATRYSKLTQKLQDKKSGRSETVVKILERLRVQLINEWKTLLRAFRKLDSKRTGYITIEELKKVLREQHFFLSDDDIYHLLTEFDLNLDGKIVYQEFIKQLLNVF